MLKPNTIEYFLKDEEATEQCAADFIESILLNLKTNSDHALVIFLLGQLGAGKTTFVRGCLRKLGYLAKVKSPTYTLVEEYKLVKHDLSIYHFDLYRLRQAEELDEIGFREYFKPHSLVFIEWPELGGDRVPAPDFTIRLQHTENGESRLCSVRHGYE